MPVSPNLELPVEVIFAKGYQIIRIKQSLERGMDLTPLRMLIEQALAEGKTRIVISLTENSFLYSEILAHLVTYYKMITARGGTFWLVQSSKKILAILETLGLSDMIRIIPSESALPD